MRSTHFTNKPTADFFLLNHIISINLLYPRLTFSWPKLSLAPRQIPYNIFWISPCAIL